MAAQTPSAGYALYLVAVNPAVVVGVPLTSGYGSCNSPGWTKCFYAVESRQLEQGSARHSSFVVYYNSLPPVRDGSFVLVPEWQTDSVPLPADRAVTTLGEKGKGVSLVQRNNAWHVSGLAN